MTENRLQAKAPERRRFTTSALVVAAVAGVIHGLFSLYWATGGDWLVESLGHDLQTALSDSRLLLVPVGIVKIVAGLLPLLLSRLAWPMPALSRTVCWLGSAALVLWGGANTVIGNLVLFGIIVPDGGVDRVGMIGHAWLWDPLFLVWGASLAAALVGSRRFAPRPRRKPVT